MEPQCQALNLSDRSRCVESAKAYEDKFCWYHAKQCYALYMGYKRRNKRLDVTDQSPPKYLASSKDSLGKQTFAGTEDQNELIDVYTYLFEQLNLLTKVVEARRLHHALFFSVEMDYGHQAYIDKLSNRRYLVERALERLTRRIAAVRYDKQQWFEWAVDCQDDEESHRASEKAKLQRESAMLKRHSKELEARLTRKRKVEDNLKQELFLDEVYRARLAEEDVDEWDPIQDSMEDLRASYIELIRHFLWWPALEPAQQEEQAPLAEKTQSELNATPDNDTTKAQASGPAKKKKKKKTATKPAADGSKQPPQQQPDKGNIETLEQLRQRLSKGTEIPMSAGGHLVGTIETPTEELMNRTAPMLQEEVDGLVNQIKEVKLFIFCRLLLSHAVLLPIALESASVEDFLSNPKVRDNDLREICLKMEQPPLQAVRDACADLARGEHEVDEVEDPEEVAAPAPTYTSSTDFLVKNDVRMFDDWRRGDIPKQWQSKREQERKERFQKLFPGGQDQTFTDFGAEDNDVFKRKKVRARLCGHYVWNYASNVDMPRSGWLLFSIMTNCSLHKATELCRSWNEFYELSVLTCFNYFPSAFRTWVGDRLKQQLLMLGFMPYMLESRADEMTIRKQTGSRSRTGRQHMFFEARPFICGQMRRHDPITRRFLQYMSMISSEVLILARDGKSGKILLQPPEEQHWLKRGKSGIGRAAKNEWTIVQSIGTRFFEEMDAKRTWSLSFDDYTDVYVWSLEAGENWNVLCNVVHDTSWKARRVTEPRQMYDHMAPIFSTITRDGTTRRARDIKPGEDVPSIFDEIKSSEMMVSAVNSRTGEIMDRDVVMRKCMYNEADAAEDAVLFPDELLSGEMDGKFEQLSNKLLKFVHRGPSMARWVVGAEFDEAISNYTNSEDGRLQGESEEDFSDETDFDDEDKDWRSSEDDYVYEWNTVNVSPTVLARRAGAMLNNKSNKSAKPPPKTTSNNQKAASNVLAQGAAAALQNLNMGQTHTAPTKPEANTLRGTMEIEDSDKTAGAIQKHRGTRHGWETAFAALFMADEEGNGEVEEPIMKWLYGMMDNEEEALLMPSHDYDGNQAKFMEWMEKNRSAALRKTFHNSDPLDHQWRESMDLIKAIEAWEINSVERGSFVISRLIALGINGSICRRRAYKDMARAFAQISIFFPNHKVFSMTEFIDKNEVGQQFRHSLLLDPEARAKKILLSRSQDSNQLRDRSFWKDWIDIDKAPGDNAVKMPIAWDSIIRPIVAKLYKEGVIVPAHVHAQQAEGQAVTVREEAREERDFFIFYNLKLPESNLRHIEHPSKWPDIKAECRAFAATVPGARFAVLRVFSTPYYYPLMIGSDDRMWQSFVDSIGRIWVWNFIPKDYPGSEWSMHHTTTLALQKYLRQLKLGKQVKVRRDIVLVMGKDETELAELCMGVCYAIHSRPWVREIDLWKSFVNVSLEFVEGLDPRWTT